MKHYESNKFNKVTRQDLHNGDTVRVDDWDNIWTMYRACWFLNDGAITRAGKPDCYFAQNDIFIYIGVQRIATEAMIPDLQKAVTAATFELRVPVFLFKGKLCWTYRSNLDVLQLTIVNIVDTTLKNEQEQNNEFSNA